MNNDVASAGRSHVPPELLATKSEQRTYRYSDVRRLRTVPTTEP